MTINAGARLGAYEILEPIGAGGMGEVYKAKDLKLGRDVAIKVLREDLASDPERLRRFEQEARSASSLNHPNIVTIHDIDEHEGTRYIAMEYVEGKTLRAMLGGSPLPIKKLLQLSTQVADGLAKAHAAGIVHRDLKPENLMVTDDGLVKILDFGLAKLMPQSTDADSEMDTVTKATQQGVLLGTLQYMSPEQAASRPVDYRSDQFAFGSILYEMATGRPAFKKDTMPQTLAAIIQDEPEPLITLNEKVPAHFPAIVERCLAKLPEERYDSTRDLARELRSVQEVPSVRRSRRAFVMVTTGLLAAFVALAVGLNVGGLRQRLLGGATAPAKPSVAVLPFQNLSSDVENEYFGDGMTAELISKLSGMDGLQVTSRTLMQQFKGIDKSPTDIAEELGVGYVLEGTVRKAGARVRVTAQLIDPSTALALWSEEFDGALKDVFAVQEQIALEIAEALELRLSPQEAVAVGERATDNADAYDAYLRGWALVESLHGSEDRAEEKLRDARQHFEEALDLDGDYPLALAGLALAEAYTVFYVEGATPDHLQRGTALGLRALDLEPDLAEAHIALGLVYGMGDDIERSVGEYRQAVALDDTNGYAWCDLAWALNNLDPPDPEAGERAARQATRLAPGYFYSHYWLGRSLHRLTRYTEAITAFEYAIQVNPDHPDSRSAHIYIGRAHLAVGDVTQALAQFNEARRMGETPDLLVDISAAYAGLGQIEKSLAELEEAFAGGYRDFAAIDANPHFASMRDDPRFQDLLRRMNFPE